MVKINECSFCKKQISPGQGLMYVFTNGNILHFCTGRCRKLKMVQKKNPKKVKWTEDYREKKRGYKQPVGAAGPKVPKDAVKETAKPAKAEPAAKPEKEAAKPAVKEPAAKPEKEAAKPAVKEPAKGKAK